MSEINTVTELLANIEPVVRGWIDEQIGDNAASNDPGDQFEFEFTDLADGDTIYYDGASLEWMNNSLLRVFPATGRVSIGQDTPIGPFHIKAAGTGVNDQPGFVAEFTGGTSLGRYSSYLQGLYFTSINLYRDPGGAGTWHLDDVGQGGIGAFYTNNESGIITDTDGFSIGRATAGANPRTLNMNFHVSALTGFTWIGEVTTNPPDKDDIDAQLHVDGDVVVDNTSTEAFLVRINADGGDVFTVDTNTPTVSVVGPADGGLTNYDLKVGDTVTPDYGMIQMGNSTIGRTSYKVGSIDLDGTILFRNTGGPVTSQVEFIFTESTGNTCRFALPKSGVGNATYNPRSMLIAGPAPADTAFVTIAYWNTQGIFDNLVCDTSGVGADLGVQNDLEVEGDIFVDSIKESTAAAGTTFANATIFSGTATYDGVVIIDVTSTEALLVRKNSDGGDVFAVNTTNTRVGIGTASPAATLQVYGHLYLDNDSVVSPDLRFYDADENNFRLNFISSTLQRIAFTPDGKFTETFDVRDIDGVGASGNTIEQLLKMETDAGSPRSVGSQVWTLVDATNGAEHSSWKIRTIIAGTFQERITVSENGYTGIGTANVNPAAQLDVDQASATAAVPVLLLDQGDVSEQLIKGSYSGADVDMIILELDVTGAPKYGWSETPDRFYLNKGIAIGDGGTTNYANFAGDGELTLFGTARTNQSVDVEPGIVKRSVANPPGEGTEDGFLTHDFDASTDESVFFHWEIPHDYASAGTIHIHFDFFVDTAPAGAESVVWGVEYKKQSVGDNFDFSAGTTTAYTQESITTGTPANDKKIHRSSAISLTVTGFEPGDFVLLRFFRDANGTGGTDDYTADARIVDYHIEYIADKLGEAT